jgi:hypothetical protein
MSQLRVVSGLCASTLTLAVAVSACAGSSGSSTAGSPSAAAPASAGSGASAGPSAGTTASGKVSANTASKQQIADALQAHGVSNPDRWADEVVEYRPYPPNDPSLGKLRQNLAKYHPSPQTMQGILDSLTP